MNFQENCNVKKIILPKVQQQLLIEHCLRKLKEEYLEHETKEKKAYGLIGGRFVNDEMQVTLIAPLHRNVRGNGVEKNYMDKMLDTYAKPSVTPMDKRAWVADPHETKNTVDHCIKNGWELIGTYHMHQVAWDGDEKRDTPTFLDKKLGEDTDLFMFIISMVIPDAPLICAYYQGDPDKKIPIVVS